MKFYKNDNFVINYDILKLNNVKIVTISSSQLKDDKDFKILVKVGDFVKIGTKILENKNGQKILSSVSGKVVKIGTEKDAFDNLCQIIQIENDFKNEKEIEELKLENINDFLYLCKEYGLMNNKFYFYDYFVNVNKTKKLYINAKNTQFNFINKIIEKNHFNEINGVIEFLTKLFSIKKVVFCVDKTDKNFYKNSVKNCSKIQTKLNKNYLNFVDLLNIFNAKKFVKQTNVYLCVSGGAIKNNGLIIVPIGTKINDVIEKSGGFKQDIEEIENYKYTALLAYNDEIEIKNKIKVCKNSEDKQKLEKLLVKKQQEAKENVFNNLNIYYEKFLNCLSCCVVNSIKDKSFLKDFNKSIQNDIASISFLSQKEFH